MYMYARKPVARNNSVVVPHRNISQALHTNVLGCIFALVVQFWWNDGELHNCDSFWIICHDIHSCSCFCTLFVGKRRLRPISKGQENQTCEVPCWWSCCTILFRKSTPAADLKDKKKNKCNHIFIWLFVIFENIDKWKGARCPSQKQQTMCCGRIELNQICQASSRGCVKHLATIHLRNQLPVYIVIGFRYCLQCRLGWTRTPAP